MRNYFIKDNSIIYYGPINIFDSNFDFYINRGVFMVIRANGLIDLFANEYDFYVIYLIKHPIPQAISCIKHDHHCEILEYLDEKILYINGYL